MATQMSKSQAPSGVVDEFRTWLKNSVPTAMISPDLYRCVLASSNALLDMAKQSGVELKDITIGEHCLPTWPDMSWDEAVESLHETIQIKLVSAQNANDLGTFVSSSIIYNGNLRLAKAQEMNIPLVDITIGQGLLPVWPAVVLDTDNNKDKSLAADDSDTSSEAGKAVSSSEHTTEATLITPVTARFKQANFSATNSDSESTCSDDECDMVIEMNNFVCTKPIYEDIDDINVVHDVEFLGQPGTYDIEITIVDDDEDVAHVPEVEVAIDYEGYYHHYGDNADEVVEVELEGAALYCFAGYEENEAEEETNAEPVEH